MRLASHIGNWIGALRKALRALDEPLWRWQEHWYVRAVYQNARARWRAQDKAKAP